MIADLYRFGRELKQGRNVEASKVLAEATIRCCARSGRCCCSRAAAPTRAKPW